MWQAQRVVENLENAGVATTLVPVKSAADLDLQTPLHAFGEVGIFTKMLDVALYEDQIDLAVHSLKDYPTTIPEDLILPAVLPRGAHQDVLIPRESTAFMDDARGEATVATGSIRRIAQWKYHFPRHSMAPLRGNVQTRLRKLEESSWQGAIFAQAGLARVNLLPRNYVALDWMLPAPAQGTVGIICRRGDQKIVKQLQAINDPATSTRIQAERAFLNEVEGGCSAPVGAFAEIRSGNISLEAAVFELDGSKRYFRQVSAPVEQAEKLGRETARQALAAGADRVMEKLRHGNQ